MNSKAKGEISEGHVIAQLLTHGYAPSMPFGDNQRYDLIVDDGAHLWRAQVKTARMRNGCLVFNCCSIDVNTQARRTYHGQIDIFLIVDDGAHLWRAQVKTARMRNGCLVFNCCSIDVNTQARRTYHGQIDIF